MILAAGIVFQIGLIYSGLQKLLTIDELPLHLFLTSQHLILYLSYRDAHRVFDVSEELVISSYLLA